MSVLVAVLIVIVALVDGTHFTVCKNVKINGALHQFEISGCPGTRPVCVLRRRANITVKIVFSPELFVFNSTVRAYSVTLGRNVPLNIRNDICQNSGLHCPLRARMQVTYVHGFKLGKRQTLASYTLNWSFVDAIRNATIICGLVPIQIV